jgi:hypothetical protein
LRHFLRARVFPHFRACGIVVGKRSVVATLVALRVAHPVNVNVGEERLRVGMISIRTRGDDQQCSVCVVFVRERCEARTETQDEHDLTLESRVKDLAHRVAVVCNDVHRDESFLPRRRQDVERNRRPAQTDQT